MPADTVREAVKAEIRAVTGLDPVLRGDASVSLFPDRHGQLRQTSASATTAPASRRSPPSAWSARLRFFPLLIGRIEIADVLAASGRPSTSSSTPTAARTGRAMIETLARNAGRPSRRQPTRRSPKSGSRTAPSSCATTPDKIVETLTNVELSLAWPSISKSFAATGRFAWHDETIDATISFTDFAAALARRPLGLQGPARRRAVQVRLRRLS